MFAKVRVAGIMSLVAALAALGAAGMARGDMVEFPSAGSVLTGVADIGGGQIGGFWSATLDQGVSEVLAGPDPTINRAILDIEIPQNVLVSDSVEWAVTINDSPVGSFEVAAGFTGPMRLDLVFDPVAAIGGTYEVALEVTNDIPPLGGSHTLGFADPYQHSIDLIPEPVTAVVLSVGAVVLVRRRRRG